MENIKINYIGFAIQHLHTSNIVDAIFHLGAKYGARIYNTAVDNGAIKVNTENNTIDVDVDKMNQIIESFEKALLN